MLPSSRHFTSSKSPGFQLLSNQGSSGPQSRSGVSFHVGIGGNWGSGTLTYKVKDYPVKVKGLAIGKVGMTSSSANGEVFNLKHLQDLNGHYTVGAAGTRGVTLGAGRSGTIMSNQAGVIVRVSSTQNGVAVNATGGGVDMQLK